MVPHTTYATWRYVSNNPRRTDGWTDGQITDDDEWRTDDHDGADDGADGRTDRGRRGRLDRQDWANTTGWMDKIYIYLAPKLQTRQWWSVGDVCMMFWWCLYGVSVMLDDAWMMFKWCLDDVFEPLIFQNGNPCVNSKGYQVNNSELKLYLHAPFGSYYIPAGIYYRINKSISCAHINGSQKCKPEGNGVTFRRLRWQMGSNMKSTM